MKLDRTFVVFAKTTVRFFCFNQLFLFQSKASGEMIGFTDITGVADINVAAAVAAGGPSHFVGPFPFREPMPPSAICRCNLLCKLR